MPAVKLSESAASFSIAQIIARDLSVREAQVAATIALIEEGATIPFIARYRKERTGGLDDTQLRQLAERYTYLTELQARRETILSSIGEQQKLTRPLERRSGMLKPRLSWKTCTDHTSRDVERGRQLHVNRGSSLWPKHS